VLVARVERVEREEATEATVALVTVGTVTVVLLVLLLRVEREEEEESVEEAGTVAGVEVTVCDVERVRRDEEVNVDDVLEPSMSEMRIVRRSSPRHVPPHQKFWQYRT